MTTGDDDRLSLLLGGGIAALVVALGVTALLLGPHRPIHDTHPAITAGGAPSVSPGGGAGGSPSSGSGRPGARPAPAGDDTVVVRMTDALKFTPDSIRIHPGQTVVWSNDTSVLIHTSTDDPGKEAIDGDAVLPAEAKPWDSGQLKPGERFAHTFVVPGAYRYFCIPHEAPRMTGVVVVTAEPG